MVRGLLIGVPTTGGLPGAPATAGYITKLNASGTDLIWSTLFSGSNNASTPVIVDLANVVEGDGITGLAIDASGNILFSGTAQSPNLPGLWSTPVASRPPATGQGFVARLSSDGTTLSPTQLIPGSVSAAAIALRSDGSAVVAGAQSPGTTGTSLPLLVTAALSSVGRVTWICDTADAAKIVSVVPGQLMSLYGTALAQGPAIPIYQFLTSLNGVTVTFNGIAAPILYTSAEQINLQVPYEIAGLTEVTMQVTSTQVSPPVSESYILAVVASQPSVFIAGPAFNRPIFDMATCNGQNASGLQPLALNADGTQNSCANPAASGSTITIFLNGLGVTSPAQTTGTVSPAPVAISPAAAVNTSEFQLPAGATVNFLSTATDPGSIDSIAQVQIQVTSTTSPLTIPLEVQSASGAFWVRGPGILVWVK